MKRRWFARLFTCMALASVLIGCAGCASGAASSNAGSTSSSTVVSSATATSSDSSASSSAVQAEVNRYTVTHVTGEPDWDTIPVADIDNQPWNGPVDISAYAQVCYSDDALYVHLWAREADIRAEYAGDDVQGNPYEDSCLEFFFSPVSEDSRYFNIEMNPNCCRYVGIGTSRQDRVRLIVEDSTLQPVVTRTEDGWELEYRIPFDFIRVFFPEFQVESGDEMRANFYKCGNLTVQKHYLTWNPMTSEKPDFHRPEDFGVLVFE